MADPIVDDLADLFTDTVTVEPVVGADGFGDTTYGPGVTRAARVSGKIMTVRDQGGQETVSTVQVTLAGAFGVTVKDRFTLPARFVPTQPLPIAVKEASDENGPHHETVYFQ